MALQNQSVTVFTSFQQALNIDSRQICFAWSGQVGKFLQKRFSPKTTPIQVQRDSVCPGHYHFGIAQLTNVLPAFHPRRLGGLLGAVPRQAALHKKAHRPNITFLVSTSVFFGGHFLSLGDAVCSAVGIVHVQCYSYSSFNSAILPRTMDANSSTCSGE